VGGYQYAEKFEFRILGPSLPFQQLAVRHVVARPREQGHGLIGLLPAGVIHQPVAFERTLKELARQGEVLKQGRGGVPAVQQHRAARYLANSELAQHISHVVQLRFTLSASGTKIR